LNAEAIGATQLTICMHHGEKIYRHTEHARYSVKMTYGIYRIYNIYVQYIRIYETYGSTGP